MRPVGLSCESETPQSSVVFRAKDKEKHQQTGLDTISAIYLDRGSHSLLAKFVQARKTLTLRTEVCPSKPVLAVSAPSDSAADISAFKRKFHGVQSAEEPAPVAAPSPKKKRVKEKSAVPQVVGLMARASLVGEQMRLKEPLPLAELRELENPAAAVVHAMRFRGAGSLKRAWLYLDTNNDGKMTEEELQRGLQLLKVDWSEITEFPTFGDLFNYIQELLHEHTFSTTKVLPITFHALEYIGCLTASIRDRTDWDMLNTRERWAAYSAATETSAERKREPHWYSNTKRVLPFLVNSAAKAIATRAEIKKQGPTHPTMRAFLRKRETLVNAHFVVEIQEELRRVTRRVQSLTEARRELTKTKNQLHLVIDPTYDPKAERRNAELQRKKKALEGGFFGDKFKATVAEGSTPTSM